MAVFFLATLLAVLSFELAIHAIKKEDAEIVNSTWGLGVMLAVLVINISLAAWQRMWARRLQSDILYADASHTFSDALTTIVVIVGWQLSALGYVWLDRVCALAVSVLIFYLAYSLFRRVLPILVDEVSVDPVTLTQSIKKVDGVLKVNRIRSRWIGSDKSVDLVISVDPDISTYESHNIANEIELLITEKFDVSDISIHVEPYFKKA
jgi:cation diffusion facilitator family transporter